MELPFTLRSSRKRMLSLLVAALAFVSVGLWMRGDHTVAGYFVSGFFGLCAVVFTINLLPRSSYLQITSEGFEIRNMFRSRHFAWKDTRPFGVTRVGTRKLVGWNPVEPISKLEKANQALCGYALAFPDTYGLKAEKLAELLNSVRARHMASFDFSSGLRHES